MFGHCLLVGTGISIASTGTYAVITNDKYDPRDRKNEYLTIFSIIIFISTIMLYFFNNSSESLVSSAIDVGGSSPKMNNYTKPPF
jgi:cytosine/uracil/thiamine/allantoin permease